LILKLTISQLIAQNKAGNAESVTHTNSFLLSSGGLLLLTVCYIICCKRLESK